MKKRFIIILFICILWTGCIFFNSSFTGKLSNDKSFIVTDKVEYFLKHIFNYTVKMPRSEFNTFLRKCAHTFEYCVFSIFLSLLLLSFRGKSGNTIYVLFICLFVADMDEFYQSFIPGRTYHVSDVFIDFLGCIIGVFMSKLFLHLFKKLIQ